MKRQSKITQAGKPPGGVYKPLTVSEREYFSTSITVGIAFEKTVKALQKRLQTRDYY